MRTLWQDVRYGARMIWKRPGFTAVVVLALALGIGANTAIFSVVNAVLLRPLPFQDPERIVVVSETVRRETVERRPLSYPDFVDWREQNQVFAELAAFDTASLTLTGSGEPERVEGEIVSASYFPLLGAQAAVGRTFLASEDVTPDTHPVVVLSHTFWQRRFNGDASVIGSTINFNERAFTVVGIMPENFRGVSGQAEAWIPMMMLSVVRSTQFLQQRGTRWHAALARLKPGVSVEQAQAEMDTIMRRLEQEYQDTNRDRGALVIPAQEEYFSDIRPTLLVLLGAVGFVLLIACANVANLLLARAASRQKEIAIRTALGAGRWRLVRQLLTESVLLALLGGAVGLLFAVWGVDFLAAMNPVELPTFVRIRVDAWALGFTLLISLLVGVVFGLAPALQASRPDLNETLKEGGRSSSGGAGRQRLRGALVVAEVALALVLLVGAGLMLKSFQRLQTFDPGFRADNLLTMWVSLPTQRYNNQARAIFSQQLLERLAALPGAQSAALASDFPLSGSSSATNIILEGAADERAGGESVRIYRHSVSPGFFNTLGISLLRGRDFNAQDTQGAQPVAIISEAMARRYWPEGDAMGQRFRTGGDNDPWVSIVGIVGNAKHRRLINERNTDPDIYYAFAQAPTRDIGIVIRSATDAASLTTALRREAQSLDANLPLYDIQPMAQRLAAQTAGMRFSAWLLGIFAAMALLLAAAGIYGVMSYSVTQRTHEIAIRMALGARAADVLRMVVGQGMRLVLLGVGICLAAAFALTRLMRSLLYEVSATDPLVFILIALLLTGIALIASYIPARRATKVDPMEALRYE